MRSCLLFATLLGPACSPCDVDVAPSLVLGSSAEPFARLVDGAGITAVWGPQGGQHLEIALETTGFEERVLHDLAIEGRVDGEIIASDEGVVDLHCEADGVTQHARFLRFVQFLDYEASAWDGKEVVLDATVTSDDGETASASVAVILDAG